MAGIFTTRALVEENVALLGAVELVVEVVIDTVAVTVENSAANAEGAPIFNCKTLDELSTPKLEEVFQILKEKPEEGRAVKTSTDSLGA